MIKFATDYGPIIIFFTIYLSNDNDLKLAIPPFIIATLIALAVIYFFGKENCHGTTNKWSTHWFIWRSHFVL